MLYYKQSIDKNYCKTYAYQIYKWKKPNIFHMYVFRCKCVELNNRKDNFDKFDAKLIKVYSLVIPLIVNLFELIKGSWL